MFNIHLFIRLNVLTHMMIQQDDYIRQNKLIPFTGMQRAGWIRKLLCEAS